ncbi:MAG: hypothetical protein HeimC3_29400 [Candidatus Heimdallarchaeota archaeon LC_3]|nr:MAG: hypothetical protein HeimC3_29400 [Candidatus Heimdallarchaeota archaeon LC_3]
MTISTPNLEILFQNNQKAYVGIENDKLLIKTSNNEQIRLELDPIALQYLFKVCLDKIYQISEVKIHSSLFSSNNQYTEPKTKQNFIITKKPLTYDRVFEILDTNDRIKSSNYSLDLSDDEWREILLEAYRTRKTYAGAIIKNLQEVGLPIEDVQVGRVLKKMREEGFIRGTQKKSQKTGNLYYLLEFPPYKDDGL